MKGLENGSLFKAFAFPSKALLVPFFPLLFLVLTLPPIKDSLVLSIWRPLDVSLEGPAFAFLLLNCVIVTIFTSSKWESKRRGYERSERMRLDIMGQINDRGDGKGDLVVEVALGEIRHTPSTTGYDSLENNTETEEKCYYRSTNYCYSEREEESKREPVATGLIEEGEKTVESIKTGGARPFVDTRLRKCHDCHIKIIKGQNFPRRSSSLNARRSLSLNTRPYVNKIKHDQTKVTFVNDKKPIRGRGRVASKKNDKLVGLHPIKPLNTDLKKKQLLNRDSPMSSEAGSPYDQKPALQNNFDTTADEKCVEGLGRAENFNLQHPVPAAATAHPSMDEVWAAICMSSGKGADNRMAQRSKEPKSKIAKRAQPAAATVVPAQPASAPANTPSAAAAAANPIGAAAANAALKPARKALVDAAFEDGRGSEELNHRAEKFIARFNCQVRLQREESLQQRQKRGHRGVQSCSHARQRPAQGLLMG